jgi:ATP-dependent DNA helicase RecG
LGLSINRAAQTTEELLKKSLPELKVSLIHGKIKNSEKEKIMAEFKSGNTDLLVATTVIEVGVDVPNASVMVIENPERLGLAQLHQLRGRVGRGSKESYCILLFKDPLSYLAQERLKVLRESQDGFVIAEKDLELRGPGELLGTRQTGDIQMRVADLQRDKHLFNRIQHTADELLAKNSSAIPLIIHRWLGNVARFTLV